MSDDGARTPIVVGVRGDEVRVGELAFPVDWAAREATARGVPLWLAHAYLAGSQRSEVAPDEDLGVAAHRAVRSLERTAARLAAHYPDLPVAMFARCGTPVAVLGDIAAEAALVVGRHSGGRVAEAVLGSVTPGRLPHPLGPVVAVPAQPSYVVREAPIIVGVGERGPSPAAVNFAFQQASVHDAPIRLVHCVRDSSEIWTEDTQVLAAVETYQRGRPSVRVSVDVLPGDPGELLVKESLTASLLVLGPGRGWGRCPAGSGRWAMTSSALPHARSCSCATPSRVVQTRVCDRWRPFHEQLDGPAGEASR